MEFPSVGVNQIHLCASVSGSMGATILQGRQLARRRAWEPGKGDGRVHGDLTDRQSAALARTPGLLWLKPRTLAWDVAWCQPEREKGCGSLPGCPSWEGGSASSLPKGPEAGAAHPVWRGELLLGSSRLQPRGNAGLEKPPSQQPGLRFASFLSWPGCTARGILLPRPGNRTRAP